jgi:hypothetical protein
MSDDGAQCRARQHGRERESYLVLLGSLPGLVDRLFFCATERDAERTVLWKTRAGSCSSTCCASIASSDRRRDRRLDIDQREPHEAQRCGAIENIVHSVTLHSTGCRASDPGHHETAMDSPAVDMPCR